MHLLFQSTRQHFSTIFGATLNSEFSSVAQSCLTLCDPRVACPVHLPTPKAYSNSCALSQWCHPTISSSVVPFSSHLRSFPASGSFQMSQFCESGGQSIGVSASASVLPMNIQDGFPLGWTGWISLQSKGLSGVSKQWNYKKKKYENAKCGTKYTMDTCL